MKRTKASLVGLTAAAALVVPASATAVPVEYSTGTAVAEVGRATPIDAGRGIAVFSVYDSAAARFRLGVSDGGPVRLLKASPRTTAFDASVGTDARGQTVVTYTLCRRSSRAIDPTTYVAYWPEQSGCRVRSVDIKTGKTRTLKVAVARGRRVWLPVQDGTTLAYGRLRDLGSRRSGSGDLVHRYRFEVVRQDGSGRARVLLGGPAAEAALSRVNGQDLGVYGAGVTSLDLDGSRTAYTWRYATENCPNQRGGPARPYATIASVERGARRTQLARSCVSGAAGSLSNIDLLGGRGSWLHLVHGSSAFFSSPLAASGAAGTPVTETAIVPPGLNSVVSSTTDENVRWYVTTDGSRFTVTRDEGGA